MGDGGGWHWLVRMEWCPAIWSVCLPLLISPCTIKSTSPESNKTFHRIGAISCNVPDSQWFQTTEVSFTVKQEDTIREYWSLTAMLSHIICEIIPFVYELVVGLSGNSVAYIIAVMMSSWLSTEMADCLHVYGTVLVLNQTAHASAAWSFFHEYKGRHSKYWQWYQLLPGKKQ